MGITEARKSRVRVRILVLGLLDYSLSNPWLVNFNVRLFSVTVRTI